MSETHLTLADFWKGLSPEDAEACYMDHLLYGHAFAHIEPDGSKRRVAPEYWPPNVRPDFEALDRAWGRKAPPCDCRNTPYGYCDHCLERRDQLAKKSTPGTK